MKIEERVENIRLLIWKAFDKRLQQLGLMPKGQYDSNKIFPELLNERRRCDDILDNLISETGEYLQAREKLIDELCFTLFNRIVGIKVLEAHELIHPVFTRDEAHGGRSFGHKLWLERFSKQKENKLEGLREYIQHEFTKQAERIQLYSPEYLYDMLPDVFDLNSIIREFNEINLEDWLSDDIMGWMYEYYNRKKRKAFKDSGEKIEYQWVSLTSQLYTPRWVVEFIMNNSLGKLWMEMHPESKLKDRHDIANIPDSPTTEQKPVKDIKVLDPAVGSGNFLLYAFDLFYEIYLEEGKTPDADIPQRIIENNLFGVDLDDRAVQIAQLGLYIKALKKNKDVKINHTNVVSTDFFLPDYEEIQDFFVDLNIHEDSMELLKTIWSDLQMAHKFGSLIRIEEQMFPIIERYKVKKQRELFDIEEKDLFEQWEKFIIPNIRKAIAKYSFDEKSTTTFFHTKSLDSLIYVEILQKKYDVVVANPPYTDSGDYGQELKAFMLSNYKKPSKFYNNLYSAFLKRGTELIQINGKVGYVHPPTFMYIKTFEDMRKYIVNNYHINIFIEWGYLGIFSPTARVDSAIYILENKNINFKSIFIKLNDIYETKRKGTLFEALNCFYKNDDYPLLYRFDQSKFKQIKSWPFIYWISDDFRKKFWEKTLDERVNIKTGLSTGDNNRFIRFWWEISKKSEKWLPTVKGGPYEKWYGNLWLLINWFKNGAELKEFERSTIRNEKFFFLEGVTSIKSSSRGNAYRYLPKNFIFTDASPSFTLENGSEIDIYYLLGFLNSKISDYCVKCLNPTVNTQVGDLQRIPFAQPNKECKEKISLLAKQNVSIKKHLCKFSIIEMNYAYHPLIWIKEKTQHSDLRKLIKAYLDYENEQLALVYLNEAIIDELTFEIYELSSEDRQMVLDKEGISIGSFSSVDGFNKIKDELPSFVKEKFNGLDVMDLSSAELHALRKKIESLYEHSYTIEEISEKVKIHPLSIVQILKETAVLPIRRMNDLAKDFLFDAVREVLHEDDDGIIPLIEYSGEVSLQKRLFDKLIQKRFSSTQIGNFRDILGKDINLYLGKNFFDDLCNRLNLFQYFPKTPFIWHITAGEHGSFDAFVFIYNWSRDKMYRLRAVYVEKRESSLKNRLVDLENDFSIPAQAEKEKIQNQLIEIKDFKQKIDEILQSGYDPKLDDGVGKNIAPLQKKGMLKVDVLKENQLKKYLEADW